MLARPLFCIDFPRLIRLTQVLAVGVSSHEVVQSGNFCSGQVISDSLIDFFDVDSRSKALGDKLPSFECSLLLL